MQIVIPMSGFGERFRAAGYKLPKPLILVDNKPIIQHVIEMFPGETDFIFICNSDHLANADYNMRSILNSIMPSGKIVSIDPHKLGPIHAVLSAIDLIDLDQEVIVNYCDFGCYWDFNNFKKHVRERDADGAIPSYKGFHPHTLWSNYYAYLKETDGWVSGIQEKKPFTSVPTEEYASSGTYYFKNGNLMKIYFDRCVSEELKVNGEYYVSMSYEPMINDGKAICVYELEHFMQWGTPADLKEYEYWSNLFASMMNVQERPLQDGYILMPMAGLGSRFKDRGFEISKPLIPVSGNAMAVAALNSLPNAPHERFVLRADLSELDQLKSSMTQASVNPSFIVLNENTDGQASTCLLGADDIDPSNTLTIGACDNGLIYKAKEFEQLMSDESVDVIVWTARGYPGAERRPEMYGWVQVAEDNLTIKSISVKKPLKNASNDPIVVGTFTFKRFSDFTESVARMKSRSGKINGEYYVDTAINDAIALGKKCVVFDVDYYLCWGTPDDLDTYKYWESCFHKWDSHPFQKLQHNN